MIRLPIQLFLIATILHTSQQAAEAQQSYELSVPNKPGLASTAEFRDGWLTITDSRGQQTLYERHPESDSRDRRFLGYFSRQANQILQWPVSGRGNMNIFSQATQTWRQSKQRIRSLTPPVNNPQPERRREPIHRDVEPNDREQALYYQIECVGTKRLLHADGKGNQLASVIHAENDDYTKFALEQQEDSSYRLRVKADCSYLGVGITDDLVSCRDHYLEEYSRFAVEEQSDGTYTITSIATGAPLHVGDPITGDQLLSARPTRLARKESARFRMILVDPRLAEPEPRRARRLPYANQQRRFDDRPFQPVRRESPAEAARRAQIEAEILAEQKRRAESRKRAESVIEKHERLKREALQGQ